MSLVFAAHIPHSSLFIESIGGDSFEKIEQTKKSLEKIEKELYLSKAQILLIISNEKKEEFFSINGSPELISNFEDFGEYNIKKTWDTAVDFITLIKNNCKTKIKTIIEEKINNSVSVPLFYLTKHNNNIKVLVINTANLSKKEYLDFGKELKNIFIKSSRRIAVIASGNMSHSLFTESPAGYTKEGIEYDKKIIELLEAHNSTGVNNLDDNFVKNAHESNYHSLLLLLSIIQNMNYEFKNLSYESPFGVGYLSGYFDFK